MHHQNYLAMQQAQAAQQQQQQQHYASNVFSTSPPLSNTPPPPSPEIYEALSPPLSGSDTSGDGLYHPSNSSSANSPSSSRGHSLVHRTTPNRYNPPPSPTSSGSRHRRGRSHGDSDEEDMGIAYNTVENLANSRKEATRRQRIEAEQRRRDELRDGYAKLKDALPSSNQKSSKVSLLERGASLSFFPLTQSLCTHPAFISHEPHPRIGRGEPAAAEAHRRARGRVPAHPRAEREDLAIERGHALPRARSRRARRPAPLPAPRCPPRRHHPIALARQCQRPAYELGALESLYV